MNFLFIRSNIAYIFIFHFILSSSFIYSQKIQYVNPRDGAEFVSPKTNIIIRTGALLDVSSVKENILLSVFGSRSGEHTGIQDIADDGKTMLFQPDTEFAFSEIVTVSLLHGLKTVNEKNIEPFTFTFTIASRSVGIGKSVLAISPDVQFLRSSEKIDEQSKREQYTFQKLSDNLPPDFPQFKITVNNNPAPGDLFFANNPLPGAAAYLAILKDSVTPLFTRQTSNMYFDFKMQPNGLLTYYPHFPSYYYALDSSYAIVDSFMCGNGYRTDYHDLRVLNNGHAFIMATDEQQIDMSQLVKDGMKDARVIGMIIQEIDEQKRVVFEWRSWDHYKIMDAIGVDFTQPTINYVWGNSVDLDSDGNVLFSSRNLCEITKINRQTGEIIWRLGGKNNQFTFINDTLGFNYQHDARRLPNGNITLLDNGPLHNPPFSRAVEYKLDEVSMTVTLVWQYRNTPDVFSLNQGNVQRLPNGNTLIGWGYAHPSITEVRPDGSKAFEFNFTQEYMYSYRAFKFPWKSNATSAKETPSQFSLGQNYPNPISLQSQNNSRTTIQYSLSKRERVQLTLYDLFGREVETFVDDVRDSGQHIITFDGSSLSSGVYFYRIITPTFTQTKSMVVCK